MRIKPDSQAREEQSSELENSVESVAVVTAREAAYLWLQQWLWAHLATQQWHVDKLVSFVMSHQSAVMEAIQAFRHAHNLRIICITYRKARALFTKPAVNMDGFLGRQVHCRVLNCFRHFCCACMHPGISSKLANTGFARSRNLSY